jgi:phosphatidylserine/phosphatidylglycerophosphate/cardiolipin synthase-like enzyme
MKKTALIAALLLAPLCAQAVPPVIETAFSPYEDSTGLVLKTIGSARKTVLVAGYSFTSAPIADALIEAKSLGVDVRVVVDKSNTRQKWSMIQRLSAGGVPVRINWNYAIMHNKFMVIDGATVETGSFNYTKNAAKHNAENVIVIHDMPPIAERYASDWQNLWDEAEAYREDP